MKKTVTTIISAILALVCILSLASCGRIDTKKLWANATYGEDTELGSGATTVLVEVKAGERAVTFTIHTDKTTLGDALLEHGLLAGDVEQYGLYVKAVNGITADFDIDKS